MELLSTLIADQTIEILSDGSVLLDPRFTKNDITTAKMGDNYILRETAEGQLIFARKWID